MGSRIKITYRKSMIGSSENHRRTLRALGLWTLGQSVTRADSPSLRGMLRRVAHLVRVEELGGEAVEVPGPDALAAPAVAQETPVRPRRRRRAEEIQQPTDEPPVEEAATPTSRRRKTVRKQAAEDTAPEAPTSPAPPKRKRTKPADEPAADEPTGGVPGGKTS